MKEKLMKQDEAQARQGVSDARSLGERLERILSRPGVSERELRRLYVKDLMEKHKGLKKGQVASVSLLGLLTWAETELKTIADRKRDAAL